jgi:hypothetical protein
MRTHVARVLRVLIPTTFALAIAVGVGVATGAIPDSGGVIHGCYEQDEGQLRVIDTARGGACRPSETPLNWNQTGPQGPKGDTGPQGPKGDTGAGGAVGKDGVSVTSTALASGDQNCPTGGSSFTSVSGTTYACNGVKGDPGPAGVSDIWYRKVIGVSITPDAAWHTLLSVDLPAGSYDLTAVTNFVGSPGGSTTRASCRITSPSSTGDFVNQDASTSNVLTINNVMSLSAPETISFQCFANIGTPQTLVTTLSALLVSNVH